MVSSYAAGAQDRPAHAAPSGIDLACRLGAEEFAIVMPNTDLDKAVLVVSGLTNASPWCVAGEGVRSMTASVGVVTLEYPDDTPDLILRRADQAWYCAKRDERNRLESDAA
jgi:two-component system cell cycle response regulator